MKRSYFVILIVAICLIFCSGCVEELAVGAAVGGGALKNTFAGVEADLAKSKELIIAEKMALQERLKSSDNDSEVSLLRTEIIKLEAKQELIETGQAGSDLFQKGINTNWTNPAQSTPWIMAAVASGLAYFQRKEKIGLSGMLNSYQSRVSDYMAESEPAQVKTLRDKLAA